ncbi:PD-(D/E)XK nuclease family protein [Maribacter sp. IgM3_T14_3]|uniref:PD-(D/E)XK nuclease family protein n=1 Tax=Maribacter sp. IgM3_T14_3 TaxID=3415140 RepID=UPI003C6F9852
MNLPSFFKDNSKSDKCEEAIDFFMSWTIRCADVKYEKSFERLNTYSKRILAKLIGDCDGGEKQFGEIKVWKQSGNIDLWVEFEILQTGEQIALIIENKMYSEIRPGQLEKYRDQALEYYEELDSRRIIYILLRPDYEINNKNGEKKECQALGYRYLNLEELKDTLDEVKTGNDLFDEFWFNWHEA